MVKLLSVVLALFGTFLLIYSVVFYEPPAFLGYIFGFFNGTALSGLLALHALRRKLND